MGDKQLHTLWYYFWRVSISISYVGLGAGTRMTMTPFQREEGEQHGAIEIIPLFTICINAANNPTNKELRFFGVSLVFSDNDTYITPPISLLPVFITTKSCAIGPELTARQN